MLRYSKNCKSLVNSFYRTNALSTLQMTKCDCSFNVSHCFQKKPYFHTSVQLKCHEENKKSNDSFSTDKLCENIPNELNEITTEIFSAIKSGNIDEALRVYQKVSITDGFHETDIVYLTLLNGLLNSKRIDDAKVIVTEFNREKGKIRATNESEKVLCNIFGEDLEVDDYLWFVDNVIFTRKYCNRRICEIIIRTMLTKYDNFDVAFDLFERIAGQFEMTSMLHQIACECIRRDDADRLKEILEISKKLHGKSNSFLDIAFAFISCDRAEQAKRLFMSLESDAALTNRVTHFVENLKSRRETKCLHDLLNATENFVSTECRAEMYSELLVLYAHENDSNAVIRELLSSMDKEEIVPDHKNLERIRKLLQKKEIEAPKSWLKVKSKDETVATLESHLVENDIEKANKLFYMCLESGTALPRNVIRYCLQKNAENGHIDIFVNLNGKFDVSTKMQIKFHAYECVAYTKAGECKKYIKLVESACNEKNADLKQLAINISERIINMIEADPDVYESYVALAERFKADAGIVKPMCFAWLYNFINNTNTEKNTEIWNKYINRHTTVACKTIPMILFQRKDTEKLRKFINLVGKKHTAPSELGKAYSYLFDLLLYEKNHDALLTEIDCATKYVTFKDFSPNTLKRIKSSSISQQFWTIVNKNRK